MREQYDAWKRQHPLADTFDAYVAAYRTAMLDATRMATQIAQALPEEQGVAGFGLAEAYRTLATQEVEEPSRIIV